MQIKFGFTFEVAKVHVDVFRDDGENADPNLYKNELYGVTLNHAQKQILTH